MRYVLIRYEIELDNVAVGDADIRRDRCEGGVVLLVVGPAPDGVLFAFAFLSLSFFLDFSSL